MAELALGLVGAAATMGAASLEAASGFVGRHESRHQQEIMETERNTRAFRENLDRAGRDVTQEEEREFWGTRAEALSNADGYYHSIECFKQASWLNPLDKMKKKAKVRQWKSSTRRSNQSLRSINESVSSGSDTSSVTASSGSPPGSNLAGEEIQDWANDVYDEYDSADDHYPTEARVGANMKAQVLAIIQMLDAKRAMGRFDLSDDPIFCRMIKRHIPPMFHVLDDSDDELREASTEVLDRLADNAIFHDNVADLIPRIIELLEHENLSIRTSAVRLFRRLFTTHRLGDDPLFCRMIEAQIPRIFNMLEESDDAAAVLESLAEQTVFHPSIAREIPRFMENLKHPNPAVRATVQNLYRAFASHHSLLTALGAQIPVGIYEASW
ncbi:hypothetical protein FB45DRAFT_122237 [Roridomyces roridus]|uniref:Uncharacterized protein n=1 Tax=Roridomyces roridus TaxID=1738132 RepID=A0AAD7FIB8_9AGAR|nr:hypothetical protein FB45DRAFT_122237 [Roridomyces roridus]